MRFSTIFLSATLAALSIAQSTESASTESASSVTSGLVPSSTITLTPAQSSQANCLSACPADDPSCRAACIVINEGDYTKQNNTIDCVSTCPKGNGTETDNLNYENCLKSCVQSAAVAPASSTITTIATTTSTAGGSTGTGSSESGSSDDVRASGTSAGSNSASSTSAAPSSSSSGSSADNVRVGVMGTFIGLGSLAFVFGL